MPNAYTDLATFQRRLVQGATLDRVDAAELLTLVETASRVADGYTRRHFYSESRTEPLDGSGDDWMWVPDLLSATTVKLDEDGNRTFELTLSAATDYRLIRKGHRYEYTALPKTALVLDRLNGQRARLPSYPSSVEIAGKWGYTEAVERLATTGTLTSASDTVLTLSADDADGLSPGQTLLLESEQCYVKAGSGKDWTVQRGVNGTTAVAHTAVAIDRYTYVPEVREATLRIATQMWKERETAFIASVANVITGEVTRYRSGIDPKTCQLLDPLVRGDYLL